ncbi:uncharacterized protein LOC108737480 [Agrilus planipennis]|uniref:phospholipase A2 n=1 Tax=Agrilus planipennis TaxID=224129 RepID=A0A1W4X0C4_AGRPL|nr:uncharacterized protein LOC108737480 [Agrilus planipennis]
MIYDGSGSLKDCEFVEDRRYVRAFRNKFRTNTRHIIANSSAIAHRTISTNVTIPKDVKKWLDYPRMKGLCKQNHKKLKEELISDRRRNGMTLSTRTRRDMSYLFQIPGTQWCGKGYRATKYTHLGSFSKTDRCCRRHDTSCPYWISAYETKYGLFNWRLNTIMHCSCDERFRACLKMADTSDANFVGKLFFNIVQTKCFVLKVKKLTLQYIFNTSDLRNLQTQRRIQEQLLVMKNCFFT